MWNHTIVLVGIPRLADHAGPLGITLGASEVDGFASGIQSPIQIGLLSYDRGTGEPERTWSASAILLLPRVVPRRVKKFDRAENRGHLQAVRNALRRG